MVRQLQKDELASLEVWKSLLGTRVSLRFRIHDDPAHPFSEAVGLVQSVGPADGGPTVTVVNRRGQASQIALDDILAAKSF